MNTSNQATPEKFLRIGSVLEMTGHKEAALYAAVSRGEFPKPVKIGKRCSAWLLSSVVAWQQECIAKSEAK